jgi:nucleoid-associated protein YgaU
MMMRRRRSPLRYLFPAAIVFAILYFTHTWPFNRNAPSGNMTTAADVVVNAYEALSAEFRARVPLTEFAVMYRTMSEKDVPTFHEAAVTSPVGTEDPVAHFDVEYAAAGARAEYDFARIDGAWDLQALRFVKAPWTLGREVASNSEPEPEEPPEPEKPEETPKALPASMKTPASPAEDEKPETIKEEPDTPKAEPKEQEPTLPKAPTNRRFPCEYTIQAGDNLSSISRHFYGTTRFWRYILEANPGLSERRLRIGRKIRIPVPPEPITPKAENAPDR